MQKFDLEGRNLVENIPSSLNYESSSHEVNHRKRGPIGKQPLRSPIHPRKVHVGVQKHSKDKKGSLVQ